MVVLVSPAEGRAFCVQTLDVLSCFVEKKKITQFDYILGYTLVHSILLLSFLGRQIWLTVLGEEEKVGRSIR